MTSLRIYISTRGLQPRIGTNSKSGCFWLLLQPSELLRSYSTSGEILKYFKNVAEKHILTKYINLRYKVTQAKWQEEPGKWALNVENLSTGETFVDECDFFINAGGYLK